MMISVNEAQQLVKQNLPRPDIEKIALPEALGKKLAGNIAAVEPSPRFTNSAMDGFAVRWEDVKAAADGQPVTLSIVGESQAGLPFQKGLKPGQTVRISTGAMLVRGADTVIPVEETEVTGNTLRVLIARAPRQHVRHKGEEFAAGLPLLSRKTRLYPAQIALLAAQGIAEVPVYRNPAVSIIVTGSELVRYYELPKPWQVRDSNGLMLSTAVKLSGGEVILNATVGDNYQDTVEVLNRAMKNASIIIFSGGVSVGPHDLVKKAARECGFKTLFWQVRQKPGKPLFFARHQDILFFGLPGNPVSAYMCYRYYVDPVIRHLTGNEFGHSSIAATMASTFENMINRAQLLRVSLEYRSGMQPLVHPLAKQGSHLLTSLSEARGFIFLEEGASLAAGESVKVITLNHFPANEECSPAAGS